MTSPDAYRVQSLGGVESQLGSVVSRHPEADLCLVEVAKLRATPALIGSAARLQVGDPVYSIGAFRGRELSLSDGIVLELSGTPDRPVIHTTAPISQGSSGGGLFDNRGRLVGITSFYAKDVQNVEAPIELLAELRGQERESRKSQGSLPEMFPIFVDEDGTWHLRTSTVRLQPNGHVRAWSIFTPPESPERMIHSIAHLYDFDCVGRRFAQLAGAGYTEPLGRGRVITSHSVEESEIKYIYTVPDTIADLQLTLVCHFAEKR